MKVTHIRLDKLDYKIYAPPSLKPDELSYEVRVLKPLVKNMTQNELFIDLGSKYLNHSLFMAASGFKCYAFEGDRRLYELSQKSIEENGFEALISLFNCDLTQESTQNALKNLNEPGMQIAAIRIGTGGRQVLLGALKSIQEHRPFLCVKQDLELSELLEDLGYVCYESFTRESLYIAEEKLGQKSLLSRLLTRISSVEHHASSNSRLLESMHKRLDEELFSVKKESKLREEELKKELFRLKNELKLKEEKLHSTLSFKWGNRLVRAKSLKKILALPYGLYKDYKEFKARNQNIPYLRKILYKELDIKKLKSFELRHSKEVKIACVLDEFSYACFKTECELLYLNCKLYKEQLLSFKPDLLLVESAWNGIDGSWQAKISKPSKELSELYKFCKDNKIPTVFWAKEDPVDFGIFLASASGADFVFTTDLDSVSKYKYYLGHGNVYCLPFAANTKQCNPIERFKREDSFCFAGAYYSRHSSRCKDFKNLIEGVKGFKPVVIYDRNYEKKNAYWAFPKEYQAMILGTLPFDEIDRAYKGYEFGININTVKHSQTMLARRVFELLASNSLVVSNFSRAVRNLFADLVLSCDNASELRKRLEKLCQNETQFKKLKLLGLRKVMSEHSYQDRLDFLLETVFKDYVCKPWPEVIIFARANSLAQFEKITKDFKNQAGLKNKTLLLFKDFKEEPLKEELLNTENLLMKESLSDCLEYLSTVKEGFFGIFHHEDFYGKNYLLDLVLAHKYSKDYAWGKGSFYSFDKELKLNHKNAAYQQASELNIRSSLAKIQKLDKALLSEFLHSKKEYYSLEKMLSLDSFNYCENGALMGEELQSVVEDLRLEDQGLAFKDLHKHSLLTPAALKTVASTDDLFKIPASKLYEWFKKDLNFKIKLSLFASELVLVCKSHKQQLLHSPFLRPQELNLEPELNSSFVLNSSSSVESFQSLVEFFDEEKRKLSSTLNEAGDIISLGLPQNCAFIRFNLSIKGRGKIVIKELILDSVASEPFILLNKSKFLLLSRQYPSYEDIYKFAFVHSRVKAYKEAGVLVDVLRLRSDLRYSCYEFENIDVMSASEQLLEQSLRAGLYTHILVHFLDEKMWEVLKNFVHKIKIIVWVHGYEIQTWQRREFEFERLSEREIEHQKKMSEKRVSFWKELLSQNYENLHLIFVSEHFKNTSLGDLNLSLKPHQTSIIHNFIDTELFSYSPKSKEHRKKILSISPFASRKYANDLMVGAIEELSQKDFFEDLEFCIFGDGVLFDSTVEPLRKFKNVLIHKKFLKQSEISEIHRNYGIFLRPTRLDTQGVSRDEAMSSGLVPVTVKITAVPEFVDENCGILVEPESAKALARAIEFLYLNPDEFLRLSKNAAQRVRKQSSRTQTIEKELRLLR